MALKLAALTGVASLVNFISALFLATFYNVQAFGVFSSQLTLATLFSIFTIWRADYFSIQDDSFCEIITFVLGSSIVICCVLIFFEGGIYTAAWMAGISLFSLCTYKSISENKQLEIGFFRVVNVLLIVAFQVYFCLVGEVELGLFYGAAIGSIVSSLVYMVKVFGKVVPSKGVMDYFRVNWKRFGAASCSWMLDNIILFYIPIYASFFSTNTELGYFNFIDRFFKAPVGIIVSSVTPFLIGRILSGNEFNRRALCKQWLVSACAVVPVLVVVYFWLEDLIVYFWGEKWVPALVYLVPLCVFYFAHISISSTNAVYSKCSSYSRYAVMQALFVLAMSVVGVATPKSLESFVVLFCASYLVLQVVNGVLQYHVLGKVSH